MCVKLSFEDLNLGPYPPYLTKHLYLWNDHRAKDVRWLVIPLDFLILK